MTKNEKAMMLKKSKNGNVITRHSAARNLDMFVRISCAPCAVLRDSIPGGGGWSIGFIGRGLNDFLWVFRTCQGPLGGNGKVAARGRSGRGPARLPNAAQVPLRLSLFHVFFPHQI